MSMYGGEDSLGWPAVGEGAEVLDISLDVEEVLKEAQNRLNALKEIPEFKEWESNLGSEILENRREPSPDDYL